VRIRSRRSALWIKTAQALVLFVSVCFSLGATDAGSRVNDLGHRMMCTCGCAQMLGECNHVGCPDSGPMIEELRAAVASGSTNEQILASFAAKYGATVLAAPTTHGFDLVGWIAPFAVFAAALLGTMLLVRRWRADPAEAHSATLIAEAAGQDPAARALREKIRRETGVDGGA
jgi:cytochrome c-type biogenesis protein CcmH/NrfF